MFSIQTITLLDLELAMSKEFRKYLLEEETKSKRAISDYISRLNRGLRIINQDREKFYSISSSKLVIKILDKLINNDEFNKLTKGVQSGIKTSFNNYIRLLKDIEEIKSQSVEHLNFLNSSLISIVEQGKEKRIPVIIKEYNILLETKTSTFEWPKWLLLYSGVKSQSSLKKIKIISRNFTKDKSTIIYFSLKQPKEVSKFLAIQAHANYLSKFIEK